MSVKTAAQSFEHKTISNNLAPKPYQNKKPKPLEKPSFLSNNNNNNGSIDRESLPTKEANKPVIVNELSSFKFKNNTTPSKYKDIQNDKATTNSNITKKVPPAVFKKPPTDEELTVQHIEEKSADQLKNEKELMKLPSGSVRNSKMMLLEKLALQQDADTAPLRRRTSTGASSKISRAGSAVSNASTDSSASSGTTCNYDIQHTNTPQSMSTFNTSLKQYQQPKMEKPNSLPLLQNNINCTNDSTNNKKRRISSTPIPTTPSISAPETTNIKIDYDKLEEDYDDVKTPVSPTGPALIAFAAPVAPPVLPVKAARPNQKQIEAENDIYDDVQQQQNNSTSAQCDQIYDDVSQPTNQPTRPTTNVPNSIPSRPPSANPPPAPPSLSEQPVIYDDVGGALPEVQSFTPAPRPIVNDTYDDVGTAGVSPFAVTTTTSSTSSFAPLKTEKTFAPLPPEKFKMPHGLDQWLKDMLTAHSARLKNLKKTANTPSSIPKTEIQGILRFYLT